MGSVARAALACALCALGALSPALSGCELQSNLASNATLTYTEDARAAYNEAMVKFRGKEWEDAKALFTELRKLFAYSRYARLAELRIADIDFAQERYSEAIAGYRDFVQSHRTDRDVEYAKYRIAKALFLDIADTLFLPPAEERDQATTVEAYKEVRGFLRDFPKSRYSTDVLYMYEVVMQRLVRHELYVARYYLRMDAFEATIARIDFALSTYPRSGLDPEALVLKGETLLKMKKNAEARAVFQKVIEEHGGAFAKVAKQFLDELGGPVPTLAPTPKAKEAPEPGVEAPGASPVPAL